VLRRGAVLVVAFSLAATSLGAAANERGLAAGFELLPLIAPRAPSARPTPAATPAARPVCVRLCDGYFFPVAPSSGPTGRADEEAACQALCPAASVALYFLPSRSDRIEDASDAGGAPYSALPAAFRYRSAPAAACGCRRAGEPGLAYWRDPTLKTGDAVMTGERVVVFRGAIGGAPYGAEAFTPVEDAPLGATRRSELGALEPARDATESVEPAIGEARRAAGAAAGEIRFLAAPTAGGG